MKKCLLGTVLVLAAYGYVAIQFGLNWLAPIIDLGSKFATLPALH